VSELEFQYERFVQGTGCAGAGDELACMRSKDTLAIQAANKPTAYPGASGPPKFYFTPCIDGDFIQDYPIVQFKRGKFIRVPVMFGNDNNDATVFVTNSTSPADVAAFMVDQFPRLTPTQTDAINAEYPLMAPLPQHASYFPSVSAAYGESTFTCPSIKVLQSYVQHWQPHSTWSYRVNIQQEDNIQNGLGTPHTFESPAIFGPGFTSGFIPGSPVSLTTYNAPIVPIIMNYWISFVRSLSPNRHKHPSAPHWEAYTREQRRLVLQTNATAMEEVPDDQLARCEFWDDLAVVLEI